MSDSHFFAQISLNSIMFYQRPTAIFSGILFRSDQMLNVFYKIFPNLATQLSNASSVSDVRQFRPLEGENI